MFFLALLGLVTMGLLAAEAFGSRRLNRSLWREGFMVTVTHERLGIGSTPSEVEGRPASPWRAEVWVRGEEGQLPRSLPFVQRRLKLPPPERVHLLDGSLYSVAGPADLRELDCVVGTMVTYAKELSAAARRLRGQAFSQAMVGGGHAEQRLTALDLLLTHFPASLEADIAAKDALADPHPAVRLRAARAVGELGLPVAQAILADSRIDDDVRVDALAHLARALPRPVLVPMLIESLERGPAPLRSEARRLCGQHAVRDAVPHLLKSLRVAGAAERRELLAILGRIGDRRVESLALANLEHDDPGVCREAVRCLGRVSRPETIVPLLEGWLRARPRPQEVQELAEAVIAALGPPVDRRGMLSLVNDDSIGAVSVPEARGAVGLQKATAGDQRLGCQRNPTRSPQPASSSMPSDDPTAV